MQEKTIIKGELKNPIILCVILPIIAIIATILFDISASKSYYRLIINDGKPDYAYGFGFGNGVNMVLYPLIIVLIIIGIIMYKHFSKVQITVTDKRVYGFNSLGKRVDLPFDSISAVGTSIFSGLAVTTASGSIKFTMLKNRDEIHEAISKLLIDRQNKPISTTTIKQEIPQSNADELKKYKDLLENGVITQEEFDAKKKQLLGL